MNPGGEKFTSERAERLMRNILGSVFPSSTAPVCTLQDLQKYPIHLKHSSRLNWDDAEKFIVPRLKESWSWARRCLTDVNLLQRASPKSQCIPCEASLAPDDIAKLLDLGIIEICDSTPLNTCNVFCVLETKLGPPTILRRRMIIEPHVNDYLLYAGEIQFPTLHDIKVNTALTPGAIVVDFASYFNHFPLPEEARVGDTIYQMCVIPTGQRQCPAAGECLTRSLVEHAIQRGQVRGSEIELKQAVHGDSYIDNVRFCGQEELARLTFDEFLKMCNELHIIINDIDLDENGKPRDPDGLFLTSYPFLGTYLDHKNKTVSLSDKTILRLHRILAQVPVNNHLLTLRETLRFLGTFVWACRVMDIPLAQNYSLIKFLRRRVKEIRLDDPCYIWPSLIPTLIETARSILEVPPRRIVHQLMAQKEMTLFTDSCPQGFGCVLFRDSTIQILAGPWKYEEHINVLECRALREGIRMLPMMSTLTHVTILVDNTSTLGAFKKTRSSNFCMNWITADIHDLMRAKNFCGLNNICSYITKFGRCSF